MEDWYLKCSISSKKGKWAKQILSFEREAKDAQWSSEAVNYFGTSDYNTHGGKMGIFEKLHLHFFLFTALVLLALIRWFFSLRNVFCSLKR